jgi:hypothetical protein
LKPFLPNLLKPLALAVIVAKNVDGVVLPQPAVKLLEKFAPLRLGDLRFGRAIGQRTEGVERIKLQAGFDCPNSGASVVSGLSVPAT